MSICTYLRIYPDALERANDIATSAMLRYGYSIREIDDMYDTLEISCHNLLEENLTNNIIGELFRMAESAVYRKDPVADVAWYADGPCSSFVVNGDEISWLERKEIHDYLYR